MPIKYENGKKVHLPYPKKNNPHSTTADAEITLRKSPPKQKPKYKKKGERYYRKGESKATTSLSQGKKTPAEHMQEIKRKKLQGLMANLPRAVDILTEPAMAASAYGAGKWLAKAVTSEKSMKFLKGLTAIPAIITEAGRKKHPKADAAMELGKGQPKVRQSIKELRVLHKKYPGRFKDIDTDKMDKAAAQAILNPKNKPELDYGKLPDAGKLTLAEVFEAVQTNTKFDKVDVHGTNKELRKTLEGTAGVRQEERTMEKAREGVFNPPHTSDLKRIWRKKKREDKKKGKGKKKGKE